MALVIGHRGAPGYRPEHTLASYALAARMGADFIEPDLVSTQDHVLVVRHEPEISGTTDVAGRPEFASRRTTRTIDGRPVTGWFTDDFTLEELRTLRARERLPDLRPRNTLHDGRHGIPTFEEVLDLRERLSTELRRTVGVYPETKHPAYFASRGLPLEPLLVEALEKHALLERSAPVFIQSFEAATLQALRERIPSKLVRLLAGTAPALREVAAYADAVGPEKGLLVPRTADGRSGKPTAFVEDAHAAGLLVHPYTFRDENAFLPLELRRGTDPAERGDALAEYRQFFRLGVDGVFSDHPNTAVAARDGASVSIPPAAVRLD